MFFVQLFTHLDTSNNLDNLRYILATLLTCNSFSYTILGEWIHPGTEVACPASFLSGWGHKKGMLTVLIKRQIAGKLLKLWKIDYHIDLSHSILSDSKNNNTLQIHKHNICTLCTVKHFRNYPLGNQYISLNPESGALFWQAVSTAWSAECLYPAVKVCDLKSSHHHCWANDESGKCQSQNPGG